MRKLPILAFLASAALASASQALAQSAGDPARGETVFTEQCGLCHTAGTGDAGQGPDLKGVVGRKAAGDPGFGYTAALKAQTAPWTPDRLDRFLAGPSELVPGTSMPVSVAEAKDRQDLIAFLASKK